MLYGDVQKRERGMIDRFENGTDFRVVISNTRSCVLARTHTRSLKMAEIADLKRYVYTEDGEPL